MLSKVSINRLLEAAAILEAFKPTKELKFDISSWRSELTSKANLRDVQHQCGTTACACGIIASQPKIRKRGFKLSVAHKDNHNTLFDRKGNEHKAVEVRYQLDYKPNGYGSRKVSGDEAAAAYFGIDESDVRELFYDEGYNYDSNITAKTVAKAIRQFVKQQLKQAA